MSKFPTVFIALIIASCAVLGCAQPIGTIKGGNAAAGNLDDFWTVPQRQYYTLGNNFVRASDLRAFASYRGIVESIPASSVEISLVKNPGAAKPDAPIPIVNGEYRLIEGIVGTGRKLIIVTYGSKTAEYSIEIRYPDGTADPDPSGPNGEGSGIGIIWQ